MGKTSGLGDNAYIDGFDLSGDTQGLDTIHGGPAPLDVTTIDLSAMARLPGLRDGSISFTTFFNPADGRAHLALETMPTADRIVSYLRGTSAGSPAACCNGKQIGYDPTRADDGGLTLKCEADSNEYGLEWGVQIDGGKRTDTEATDGTGLDQGASTTFGAQAYLHVFSVAGTSCTVSIEDSDDDETYTSLIDFTAATDAGSERKAAAGDVGRYIRVSTSGTFTSCVFAVIFVRNRVAVSF